MNGSLFMDGSVYSNINASEAQPVLNLNSVGGTASLPESFDVEINRTGSVNPIRSNILDSENNDEQ